jgi:hypothetical protein
MRLVGGSGGVLRFGDGDGLGRLVGGGGGGRRKGGGRRGGGLRGPPQVDGGEESTAARRAGADAGVAHRRGGRYADGGDGGIGRRRRGVGWFRMDRGMRGSGRGGEGRNRGGAKQRVCVDDVWALRGWGLVVSGRSMVRRLEPSDTARDVDRRLRAKSDR